MEAKSTGVTMTNRFDQTRIRIIQQAGDTHEVEISLELVEKPLAGARIRQDTIAAS